MPELDGMETMRALRNMGYEQPIVALTANAIIGQSAVFIREGFDGFISKPIRTKELNTVLNNFIRDKQQEEVLEEAQKTRRHSDINSYQNDEALLASLCANFVKRHKNTFVGLKAAIDAGNIKLAHLMAHTLKGAAGLINETTLMQAAYNAEDSLRMGKIPSPKMLGFLEKELVRVLESLEKQNTAPENLDQGKILSDDAVMELLDKLEPLLRDGNIDAIAMLDELRLIPEAVILCNQIEIYDFNDAYNSLLVLRQALKG
jgi:CheY-like chemotaxis protein